MQISAPRGTYDILPEDSIRWQRMEERMRRLAECYGYREVRTPIFEHTELFQRGVGDSTDIVQKEMYTFSTRDEGKTTYTLRPEGTASCARAFIENRVYNQPLPAKWYYIGPMFRHDRPQAGRYRQFHQFGVEAFGSRDPAIDGEVISLMVRLVEDLGLSRYELRLNTVGCTQCRPLYRESLIQFLRPLAGNLCPDCQRRLEINPLRVLDCKNELCQKAIQGFPVLADYLCEPCREHFDKVKDILSIYGIKYILDHQLVRGLDYYTNTAFELQIPGIGAQSAVGGGGRYDGLIEEIGGPSYPGIGFALGLERLLMALRKQEARTLDQPYILDVFVATAKPEYGRQACLLLNELRQAGIKADRDYMDRSLKGQMRYAEKSKARIVVIIGDDEVREGFYTLRDMQAQQQERVEAREIKERIQKYLDSKGGSEKSGN